jgi:hypothetical protein
VDGQRAAGEYAGALGERIPSMLQIPAPRVAKNRNAKQYSAAASPPF